MTKTANRISKTVYMNAQFIYGPVNLHFTRFVNNNTIAMMANKTTLNINPEQYNLMKEAGANPHRLIMKNYSQCEGVVEDLERLKMIRVIGKAKIGFGDGAVVDVIDEDLLKLMLKARM